MSKGPLVLFSVMGGMNIEAVGARAPEKVRTFTVDIRAGLTGAGAQSLVADAGLPDEVEEQLVKSLLAMYRLYRGIDADLIEINPLVVTTTGDLVALDSKVSLDPGALERHAELFSEMVFRQDTERSELEWRGRELGLQYMDLHGDVGVLSNGAGLTMTTLDAVNHYGGTSVNFLEIGGDAYMKATPALRLVLDNPRVRSLVVNCCGAFAVRT